MDDTQSVMAAMAMRETVAPLARASGQDSLLRPGDNVWRAPRAERASVLVDGADYFAHLEDALRAARRSIIIIGWDFDHRIRLRQDDPDSPNLGALLRSLVEEHETLCVRVLVWSVAVMHAPSEPTQLLLGADWEKHERISVRLDTFHPIYAAHHQKIVVIDDRIAFVGGMDLTVRRWDRRPHRPDDPARVSPEGQPYAPIHDLQMAVDGDAAAAVGDLARERWLRGTGETLEPIAGRHDTIHPWPSALAPDFVAERIGIARTMPACGDQAPVTEVEKLTRDTLRAARRMIYIEAQYMTAPFIGDILLEHLEKHDGPDMMIVMTHQSRGFAERLVMGNNRDRLIRKLKRADRHDRLRVCYPVVRGDCDTAVMVHSKLMIIDDQLLRVGSANLNNRSMGVDTECDLAIEGVREDTRRAIDAVRWRLLGEHLDVSPNEVAAATEQLGSMVAAIDSFNKGARGMACFAALTTPGPVKPVACTSLLDPCRPFEPLWFLKRRKRRG